MDDNKFQSCVLTLTKEQAGLITRLFSDVTNIVVNVPKKKQSINPLQLESAISSLDDLAKLLSKKEFKEMMEVFSKVIHEYGFCEDPLCEYKGPKKVLN